MTTLTDTQVITASGGLVELGFENVTSTVTVSSTTQASPTNVTSAVTVVSDGSPMLVEFNAPYVEEPASGTAGFIMLWVDGAESSTLATLSAGGAQAVSVRRRIVLSAGSHTIQIRAFKSGGTFVFNASAAQVITFRVSKIVQATQWPAVTTGTIICTSSTRPASPFEGQTIYETDTKRQYLYSGSAWVSPDTTYKPPLVVLKRTTDLSYTAGTDIAWSAEDYDTDSMWSTGATVTINTAGLYRISGSIDLRTTSTLTSGSDNYMVLKVGGTAQQYSQIVPHSNPRITFSFVQNLNATNTLTIATSLTGGGTLTIKGAASGADQSRMVVQYLGKPD